ncbi:hypothetical protein BC830DRAFT_1087874 [Chytriomyces sp. MP71]|nr:hypothetical protein BC830DRAFT_1087874 [Chytriomyces sp. MP71]
MKGLEIRAAVRVVQQHAALISAPDSSSVEGRSAEANAVIVKVAREAAGAVLDCITSPHSFPPSTASDQIVPHGCFLALDSATTLLKAARQRPSHSAPLIFSSHFVACLLTSTTTSDDTLNRFVSLVVTHALSIPARFSVFAVMFLLACVKTGITFQETEELSVISHHVDETMQDDADSEIYVFALDIANMSPQIVKLLAIKNPQTKRKTLQLLECITIHELTPVHVILEALYPFAESLIKDANALLPNMSSEATEFWYDTAFGTSDSLDRQSCRHLISLGIRAIEAWIRTSGEWSTDATDLESCYVEFLRVIKLYDRLFENVELSDDLFDSICLLICDNDDYLIEIMLVLVSSENHLVVSGEGFSHTTPSLSKLTAWFSIHRVFARVLSSSGWDVSMFIDLLMSNETRFLEFLVAYTKLPPCLSVEPDVLESLRDLAERVEELGKANLFPYNTSVLVKRLYAFFDSNTK